MSIQELAQTMLTIAKESATNGMQYPSAMYLVNVAETHLADQQYYLGAIIQSFKSTAYSAGMFSDIRTGMLQSLASNKTVIEQAIQEDMACDDSSLKKAYAYAMEDLMQKAMQA